MTTKSAPTTLPTRVLAVEHVDHEYDAPCMRCALEREHDYREQAARLRRRIDAVLALPTRCWSEDDADSPEARSARAYNHALAQVVALLARPEGGESRS
jgi:hypothetical protein